MGSEDDRKAQDRDHQHGGEEDEGLGSGAVGQQNRCQTQNAGEHIHDGNALLLAQAHVDEPVVDVAPVGGHGVLALGQTADDRKAHIEEGHAQDQERDHEGDHRIHLEQALDRNGGQQEAQEGGAGVAHEDLGGVEIIGNEAQAGTQQRRQDHHRRGIDLGKGSDEFLCRS